MNTEIEFFAKDDIAIQCCAKNRTEAFIAAGDFFERRLGITSSSIVDFLTSSPP